MRDHRNGKPLPRSGRGLKHPQIAKDKQLVEEARDFIRGLKREFNVCADCEREYPPYVLEFDHVDPETKRFNVGNASSVPSMAALIEEVNKCDLVCSNCHKIREHERKWRE